MKLNCSMLLHHYFAKVKFAEARTIHATYHNKKVTKSVEVMQL